MESSSTVCDMCGAVNQINQTRCLACGQPLPTLPFASTVLLSSHKLLKQQYRILHVIGKGGMGTVYVGEDVRLGNRLVAIKEMSQVGLSPAEKMEAANNFKHEAHLLAELQHPNLPSIYDHFEENQRWYLVMSFVKGQTLAHYLEAQGGKLPPEEVLEIGMVLCNVLNYLHMHRPPIIFRDLKPSNIMRTPEGHIYLIDFGLARFFKPGQTKDTTNYGSFGYAAPEQYGKAQTTVRSDIYSFGATLYELLSGYELANTPFYLPPLRTLVPTIPPQLATLTTRMLDLDEQKRPQSVESVKLELQLIANNLHSNSRRFDPVKKQNRLLVIISVLGLLIVIGAALAVVGFRTLSGGKNTNTTASAVTPTTVVTATAIPTAPGVTNTPYAVVTTFCQAMSSEFPDFQTAYSQLSSSYQNQHSITSFEEDFQGTNLCGIATPPDSHNQAIVTMNMICPPPPGVVGPPPNGGQPPHIATPVDLTLVNDGKNGWRINSVHISVQECPPPSGAPPAN
jgi:serine/threonine protein kinase